MTYESDAAMRQGCQVPPEAVGDKDQIFPRHLWREDSPADTLILEFWPPDNLKEYMLIVSSCPLCIKASFSSAASPRSRWLSPTFRTHI